LINTPPEPFSNWAASFGEDMLVGVLMYLALAHPVGFFIVLALLIALAIWMLPRLVRVLRAMIEKIRRWFGAAAGRPDA
jgi:ABC-type phosphate transport system permease subunit